MPLDPSIILGAKPPQIDMAQFSPMNALTNVMKFKQADQETQLNALKMQEYERARREEEGLREFVGGSKGVPGADLNLPDTRTNLLRYGKTGAAYAKALSEADTAALQQKKIKFEIQETRGKFVAQAKRDISQNPSDANITAYKEDLLANDLFTADEKKQMAAAADKILALPVNERTPFLASQGASASELKPTLTSQDLGSTGRVISRPAFGGAATVVPGSEFTKGKTFADVTSERQATTSAGQLELAKRKFAWEQANPGFEIKEAEDGSIVGVNKRTLQAFPVSLGGPVSAAEPATSTGIPSARVPAASNLAPAAAPVPLRGKGTALTETQSNATSFGLRMKEADSILTSLEKSGVKNTGVVSNVVGGVVGIVPLIGDKLEGMTGSVFNILPQIMGGLSPEQQQTAQARLNFITANLRKESGATLLPSEFITEEKKYFPKPGDDATVIAQKQKARKLALKAMEIQAGPGAKEIQKYQTDSGVGGSGIPNATATNPLGLTIPGVR